MDWGCGLPEPLGICVAGYRTFIPTSPIYVEPPLDAVAGYPDRPSTGRGLPGPST